MNTLDLIHRPMVDYWEKQYRDYEEHYKYNMPSRFDRAMGLGIAQKTNGDVVIEQMTQLFMKGFGLKWTDTQIKIFNTFVDGLLPRIYLDEWPDVKERVLRQRGLDETRQETLVNMARRNGKTWSVSACCAAAFLCIKGISIAVFSVGKRQSGMFLQAFIDKIERAFNTGTHAKRSDYKQLQKNQEVLVYELPDGSVNTMASLPGSIKVMNFFLKLYFFDFYFSLGKLYVRFTSNEFPKTREWFGGNARFAAVPSKPKT